MENRTRALRLFRELMRTSSQFSNYNFREYALRRVRLGFREHMGEKDGATVGAMLSEAERQLHMVRRQALISQLYPQQNHVLEGAKRAMSK